MSMREEDRARILAAAQKIQQTNAAAVDAERQERADREANVSGWQAQVNGIVLPVLHELVKTLRSVGVAAEVQHAEGNASRMQSTAAALMWGGNPNLPPGAGRNEWRLVGDFTSGKFDGLARTYKDDLQASKQVFPVPTPLTPEWVSESVSRLVANNLPSNLKPKSN